MCVRFPSGHFPLRKRWRSRNLAPAACAPTLNLLGATQRAFPKFYFLWNSGSLEGTHAWPPHTLFKASPQREPGSPPISLSFHHCPLYHDLTISLFHHLSPSFSAPFVSPSSCVSWPTCTVFLPPPPFCVSTLPSSPL